MADVNKLQGRAVPVVLGIAAFLLTLIIGRAVTGPTVCRDGWLSGSVGSQGTCSHHGGVDRRPQALVFTLGMFVGFGAYVGVKRIRRRTSQAGGVIAAIRDARQSAKERSQIELLPCPECGKAMTAKTTARRG
ncbi:MAG: hypothetical protein ABWY82_12345 [Tardiphaga sp.]|jgi:hypothetical protein